MCYLHKSFNSRKHESKQAEATFGILPQQPHRESVEYFEEKATSINDSCMDSTDLWSCKNNAVLEASYQIAPCAAQANNHLIPEVNN